jgi:putative hydrolase
MYWDIDAVAGVELTNVPAKSIDEMAGKAKELGAELVVVHGETIVEDVERDTNMEAVKSEYVDILAHPGILTIKEARLAAKNGVFLEITSRAGHDLTNGVVVNTGREAGARFLINSDAHSHLDLFTQGMQEKVGLGAGLKEDEVKEILGKNYRQLFKRINYSFKRSM